MKRLLLVEDDLNTLRGLEVLLRNDGYWVKGVTRGQHAFAVVEREHIDAVLCDYRLPDIDGLQVCRKLRQLSPHLSLFLLTAYNTVEIARGARECGVEKVFHKPLDLDELFTTLFSLRAAPEEKVSCTAH
jgi:two-component system response regulator HydG